MKRVHKWMIVLALTASAGFLAWRGGQTSAATPTPPPEPSTATATATATTDVGPCAFVWATHDDVKLSAQVDAMVKALEPSASANASLYGEDCVYADGRSTFGAMETDFYVQRAAADLADFESFGNWMKPVADSIVQLPRESVQGALGYIDFWFIRSDSDKLSVRLHLSTYQSDASGKGGAELFRMFYTQP